MVKTAELTVVQKMVIDTLHKEGKTQMVIAKKAGCSQSCLNTLIEMRMEGKDVVEQKCTSNRDNHSLERIMKQGEREIQKEWTAAGVSGLKTTSTRTCKTWISALAFLVSKHSYIVRSVSPGLKTELLLSDPNLFFDESQFCISFGN